MSDATDIFFEQLEKQRYFPKLAMGGGTVRFDIARGGQTDQWFVSNSRGKLSVSQFGEHAECAIVADRVLFNEIVSGQTYFPAAVLRGDVSVEGNPQLILVIQRLFTGKVGSCQIGSAAERGAARHV